MLTRFLLAVGRHRRVVVVLGLVLSAGYLLLHRWAPSLGRHAFGATTAAAALLLVLAVVAVARRQPTIFVVRPRVPAFSSPPQPAFVFLALAFLTQATGMLSGVIRDHGSEPFGSDQLLTLAWAVVAALYVVLAWRDQSVQLRPDGLWQPGITGRLVVPWEAAPAVPTLPPPPRANTVPMTFGRPELVRRDGLHVFGYALRTHDIDPRLIAAAIGYYVAHPEHRAAIGTQAEYDRLMPLLLDSPTAAIADRWR